LYCSEYIVSFWRCEVTKNAFASAHATRYSHGEAVATLHSLRGPTERMLRTSTALDMDLGSLTAYKVLISLLRLLSMLPSGLRSRGDDVLLRIAHISDRAVLAGLQKRLSLETLFSWHWQLMTRKQSSAV
jgi:hypothetical protein